MKMKMNCCFVVDDEFGSTELCEFFALSLTKLLAKTCLVFDF